ncbi:MAG: hypothetical protein Q8876_02185 [Bacillota bacterium]|nr:hypothetical protein [Bacillota bacterium]
MSDTNDFEENQEFNLDDNKEDDSEGSADAQTESEPESKEELPTEPQTEPLKKPAQTEAEKKEFPWRSIVFGVAVIVVFVVGWLVTSQKHFSETTTIPVSATTTATETATTSSLTSSASSLTSSVSSSSGNNVVSTANNVPTQAATKQVTSKPVSSSQSVSSTVSKAPTQKATQAATQLPTFSTSSGSGFVANGTAVKKGQKVQYTLYLKAGPKNVEGFEATVLYNANVLKYSSSSFPILTDALENHFQNDNEGEFFFNCSNVTGYNFLSGGATVVLTFDVIANGTINITPDIKECYGDNGGTSNWLDYIVDNKIVASGVKAENQIKIIG